MDVSKGKEKSQPSAPVVGSQEYAFIDTKTSSQDTAFGRLSQTADNHAQWVLQQQQTSPGVAIENTGKEVVARLEEKGDELIKLLAAEVEKAAQRREEAALQRWKDGVEVQLKAVVDTMPALIRQAPDQQWSSLQAVRQIVAEQFQRNDEQSGSLAVDKAGERLITLLERKGEEQVKSMMEQVGNVFQRIRESVDRGVEVNVAQMMEEIRQGWKEILVDHKKTATDTSHRLTQYEQGLSSLQGIDEWRTLFDTRITSEIKSIKDMAAAQSKTLKTIKDAALEQSQILNAIMQQIQKGYQEQRIKELRLAHPRFNDGGGSNSGDRLSPVNLHSSRPPQAGFQGSQDSISSQHPVAHSVFHPSVAPRGRQAGTIAQPDTMCRKESHEAGTKIAQHQTSAPTAASFSNNVVTPIQAATSSTATSTTATTTTKTKLAHKRKVVTGPTPSTTETEVQTLMSAERSTSQTLLVLPRGKQVKYPTAITSGAKQRTLVSTRVSAAHALSAIAKGKQVSRREPPPPQATDSITKNLQDHAGLLRSSSIMTASAWTSITGTSALLSPSSSVLSSASSQNASKLVHMDASGGYIVIQGLNDAACVPIVTKLPRGRLRKTPDNNRVLSQGPLTSTMNKRRKVAPNLALRPALEFSSAPTLARSSTPSRRALYEHSYAQRANVIATSQDSNVKIKAEDIVVLTPRLTRASRMKLLPGASFLDLDSVKKQVEEAGGAWRY
ncbi:hypothetical protein BGX24_012131 [Mortierella sp. AD032]|nr:hypothetical protein BGX24_012131 [Mortierella sp. AD032]